MTDSSKKARLLELCLQKVTAALSEIEQALHSASEAANDATKSTAGDKYETTRAMMHLEQEKLATQLSETRQMKHLLMQIDLKRPFEKVGPGSLVATSSGNYFLSVGLGKIEMAGETYFVVSPASPIGQALRGKAVGEQFSFRNQPSEIIGLE